MAEFEKKSENGQDLGVKNFSAKTLPTLEEHLKLIEKIQPDMGSP